MINRGNCFHQQVQNDLKTHDNIQKQQLVKVMITQLGLY